MIAVGVFGIVKQARLEHNVSVIAGRDVPPLADLRAAQAAHLNAVVYSTVLETVRDPQARTSLQQALQ